VRFEHAVETVPLDAGHAGMEKAFARRGAEGWALVCVEILTYGRNFYFSRVIHEPSEPARSSGSGKGSTPRSRRKKGG